MNPLYLGDAADIAKRFFCATLAELGYTVYVDPMFTGAWSGEDEAYGRFIGATHILHHDPSQGESALFFDPDTGVRDTQTSAHVSYDRLAQALDAHPLVMAYDQAFSRGADPRGQMVEKLAQMQSRQCPGFYYDALARFLFVAREPARLAKLEALLCALGLPERRLVHLPA
jgi:hypothetical protein